MDLRDQFAIAAMTSYLRSNLHFDLYEETAQDGVSPEEFFSDLAYEMADAMIKARQQP